MYTIRVREEILNDPLAQLAEHLTFNQGVPRSSRGWVTSKPLDTQGIKGFVHVIKSQRFVGLAVKIR